MYERIAVIAIFIVLTYPTDQVIMKMSIAKRSNGGVYGNRSEMSALQSEHNFMLSEKERIGKQQKQDTDRMAAELTSLTEQTKVLGDKLQQTTKQSQTVVSKMAAEGEEMASSYEVS